MHLHSILTVDHFLTAMQKKKDDMSEQRKCTLHITHQTHTNKAIKIQ